MHVPVHGVVCARLCDGGVGVKIEQARQVRYRRLQGSTTSFPWQSNTLPLYDYSAIAL